MNHRGERFGGSMPTINRNYARGLIDPKIQIDIRAKCMCSSQQRNDYEQANSEEEKAWKQ